MSEEARLELRDRIRRLKRKLETAAETVDAIHSGLERMGPEADPVPEPRE